jgi:hypothetical protein
MGAENKRITLGSGTPYIMDFDGTNIPDVETICKPENRLGYISGGATIEYKPSFYTAKDDHGKAEKTIITDEEVLFKTGVLTFDANSLKKLVATGRVTDSEDGKTRTILIGGVANNDGKRYVICFHHEDPIDGDIWVIIVGQNQSGFSLAFAKDKETVIDAEFKALSQDDDGTLIKYIEEIPSADA